MKDFLPNAWRLATHRLRHLPTAVILGADRATAGRLFRHLATHPRCFAPTKDEVDYFSVDAKRSAAWYGSQFPLAYRVTRKQGHVLEASSSYLQMPSALRQMQERLPRTRLIVLLGDPVAQAFAHYKRQKSRQLEPRSFAQCVAEEIHKNDFPAKLGVALHGNAAPMSGYVARGYYGLQLELLLKLYPRNKVLLMDSSTVFQDISAACDRVFNFLGLDSLGIQPPTMEFGRHHRESFDPRTAQVLREHYRPYDALLAEVVGQQFSWMSRAMAA